MSSRPHIPGYDVRAPLGQGTGGSVWRAERRADGLPVALKVVRPVGGEVSAALREAAVLASVRHPHVLHLYDVLPIIDPDTGRPDAVVLVTQLAAGGSLGQVLSRRRLLSPGELVTVLQPVSGALADLHALGTVHGDLSTGNILFREDGMPLVADLGTARVVGEEGLVGVGTGAGDGMVAPEVLEGFPATRESDVYQLGALAWLCLVGDPPGPGFERPALVEVSPDLPELLIDLVDRAMAPQPEDRPDAEELALALHAVAAPLPVEVAPDADGSHSLTQRLRQQAQEDEAAADAAPPPSGWRRVLPVRRRGAAAAVTADPPAATRSGRSGSPGRRVLDGLRDPQAAEVGGRHRAPEPVSRARLPVLVGSGVVALLVIVMLVGVGWPVARGWLADGRAGGGRDLAPTTAAPTAEERPAAPVPTTTEDGPSTATAVGVGGAVQDGAGSGAAEPTSQRRPTSQRGPTSHPGPTTAGSTPADPTGPADDPQGEEVSAVLQAIVDARARAWSRTDPGLLGEVVAPASPAEEQETQELERAREQGLRYEDVTFEVEHSTVLEREDERLLVGAVVRRGPLEAYDQRGRVLSAQARSDEVELELARVGDRWLLWSWSTADAR